MQSNIILLHAFLKQIEINTEDFLAFETLHLQITILKVKFQLQYFCIAAGTNFPSTDTAVLA